LSDFSTSAAKVASVMCLIRSLLIIGGADRLADAVLAHADGAALLIDLDPPPDEPFAPFVSFMAPGQPRLLQADDIETESMAAASEVLGALATGGDAAAEGAARGGRVALVALDRSLVRRVVALLLRAGVEVDDETGWKLSTTAAAGRVLARLRAAAPRAGGDDRLDWLKRWPPARDRRAALDALEVQWRNGRNARLAPDEAEAAQALWADAQATLAAWHQPRRRRLAEWLDLLLQQLAADGDLPLLARSAAGQRLLLALQSGATSSAWASVLHGTHDDLTGFTGWVESMCETLTVQRDPRPGSRVVLTPLARAVGRPFSHVVLAGADARRLGRDAGGPALLTEALAAGLGLETADQRQTRVRLALAQLLRAPALTILWRRLDGDAALSPAAAVEWLQDSSLQAGRPLAVRPVQLLQQTVAARPPSRPQPVAASALPTALSASAVESLRQCPYRFFARSVLRLSERDEVDEPLRKRDYGDWLHATLDHFHRQRQPGQDDLLALQRAADLAMQALALDPAALLAYRASLAQVLPAYRDWLHAHEAEGWHWVAGEDSLEARPADWAPQTLRGRIDRIDAGAGGVRLVLDYKTGGAPALRRRVKQPLEDTQLPFYVALLEAQGDAGEIRAAYLALDEADGPRLLTHEGVQDTAAVLLHEVGGELQRLRDGAAMPALGEGSTCDTCEARGLCRRDQWPVQPGDLP
jgi:ATP-dependent helicase/nuclease subunit B